MGDFGSAFGPIKAPEPSREEQLLAQLQMLGSEIGRLNVALVEASEDPDGRAQLLQAPAVDAKALAVEIGGAVAAAVTVAMRGVLAHERGEADTALVEALRTQTQKIMGLGKKMSALSTIPSGGSSGHVIVDSGNIALSQAVEAKSGGVNIASQATAAEVLAELRRRPVFRLDSTSASIASGAFATVHTVTPTVAVVVTGYNSDLNAAGAFNYRQRLITGDDAAPVIATAEQLSTSDNSWTQAALSVPAGTRIAVQVSHAEVTAQEFRASLAYYEEP